MALTNHFDNGTHVIKHSLMNWLPVLYVPNFDEGDVISLTVISIMGACLHNAFLRWLN